MARLAARNLSLKLAIIKRGSQVELCRALGLWPQRLSGIIGGYCQAPDELRERISVYLSMPVDTLFPRM